MSARFAFIRLAPTVLALAVGAAWPSDTVALAESYLEAQALGRRDESDPQTLDYHRDVLLPQFSARFRGLLRDCQAALPERDETPFSFVAALASDGRVLRMWSDRSPPVYACVRGRMIFERFSAPPRAPFYLYIHMRYTQ